MLESTQRRLCRVLFLLGCVLPTLAVAGFTAHRLSSEYGLGVLACAEAAIGLSVGCDRLETPRPGVFDLLGVRLGAVATCDRIRLQQVGDAFRFSAATLTVTDPAAAAAAFGKAAAAGWSVEGEIEALSARDAAGAADLRRVRVSLNGASVRVGEAAGARFESDAGSWRLDTGQHATPLAWLPQSPIAAGWGESASFRGSIQGDGDSNVAIGRFETARLSVAGLSATLATLDGATLAWRGQRLERLEGDLALTDGTLSRPLVYGMAAWLAMRPSEELERRYADQSAERFAFTRIACRARLDAAGLVLAAAGPIAVDGDAALLAPPVDTLPASRLVQAWFPDDPAVLPSRAAAIELASRLPQ